MNVIERLEFELVYYDTTVLHVSYYTPGTHSLCLGKPIIMYFNKPSFWLKLLRYCYGDIPHDVTAWTHPDTTNSDSINESSEFSQLPVTVTVCISVNVYCYKPYISLCYSFLALQGHNRYLDIWKDNTQGQNQFSLLYKDLLFIGN